MSSPSIPIKQPFISGLILSSFWTILFVLFGLYKWKISTSRVDEIFEIIKPIFWGCVVLFLLIVYFKKSVSLELFFILGYFIALVLFVGIGRLLIWTFHIRRLIKIGGLYRTAIIGNNLSALQIYKKLKENPAFGFKPVGFICDGELNNDCVLGSISEMKKVIEHNKITEIIFAIDSSHHKSLLGFLYDIDHLPIRSYIHPDLYDIVTGQVKLVQIDGLALMNISMQIIPWWENQVKRFTDIFISIIGLIFSVPLSLAVAVSIKLESEGPIIFRQKRVGKNEEQFTIYKFRSMYEKSDKNLKDYQFVEEKDPRVTKVGKLIRKWRIDEIPQLLNVLRGEMSFVGPRPDMVAFFKENIEKVPFYHRRLVVRPGLTGYAQIRQNYYESNVEIKQKLRYDLYYLENLSLGLDLKIFLSTIRFLLLGKGR